MSADEEVVVNTRLAGVRQFLADAGAEAAAIEGIDVATKKAGNSMEGTAKKGFLMNQALFTIRRFVYSGTLAITGMTTAAIGLGLAFNANMEMNTVAMAHFLGSVGLARTELNHLYQVAALTPFSFASVTDAARRFLAFGFSLKDTNKYLNILGDTAAGLGMNSEGISRLVLVFGQMRAAGRVMGGDLLQLAQIGVPALEILRKQLGLTQDQIANIGQLRIPAAVAIPALMRGLTQQFKGAAREQSRTFVGQVSTLKDYASQLMGTLTLPLFTKLRDDIIPRMGQIVGAMQAAAKEGGMHAAIVALDNNLTPRSHRVLQFWDQLRGTAHDLRIVLGGLTTALTRTWAVTAAIIAPFAIFRGVLFVLAHTTAFWIPLLQLVITYLIIHKTWLMANAFWTKVWGEESLFLRGAQRLNLALDKALFIWENRLLITRMLAARATILLWRASALLSIGLARLRLVAATTAVSLDLMLGPIGWIVLAITLVVAAIAIMYWKWDWFRNLINSTWDWIKTHWPLLLGILTGPFGLAVYAITRYFGQIKAVAGNVVGWISDKFDWLGSKVKRFFGKIPGLGKVGSLLGHIPGLASGGIVQSPGLSLVGERGPELLALPTGASVSPLPGLQPIFNFQEAWQQQGGQGQPIIVKVYLREQEIAEAVAQYEADQGARR